MMLMLASLLAVAPVLEPDPGGFARLQPRQVSATAALWAVDDDPATAFKPKLEEAWLTWSGPGAEAAKKLKVFIRAGCQDSQESFAAWARPRHVTLSRIVSRPWKGKKVMPLPRPEGLDLDGDEPEEKGVTSVELKDVAGWQEIELPFLYGFTFKVKDTYAGTAHPEVCISDVRVHTDGKVDASEEQLAFEQVKRMIVERLTRAAAAPKRVPEKLVTAQSPEPAPKTELSLQSPDSYESVVKKGRSTVSALRAVWRVPITKLQASGWRRVSIDLVDHDDASLEEALLGREVLGVGDTLLSTDDFKLNAVTQSPLAGWREKMKALQKLDGRPLECQAACMPIYASTSASALEARHGCAGLCSNPEYTDGAKDDIAGSGVFVKGRLESPDAVLIVSSRERGEREVYRGDERHLLVYENGRVSASAGITWDPAYVTATVLRWSADRQAISGVFRISFEKNQVEQLERLDAQNEHAARGAADHDSTLAFRVKR